MPEMIITVLKFLGLVVLSLLALVLIVLSLILFVPIRYKARGSFSQDKNNLDAKITWLLNIVAIQIHYDNTMNICYRILFFKRDKYSDVGDVALAETDELNETDELDKPNESNTFDKSADDLKNKNHENIDNCEKNTHDMSYDSPADNSIKSPSDSKKNKQALPRHNIISDTKTVLEKIKDALSDENNKQAVLKIKKELLKLLGKMCPKKLYLSAKFSTGEPDTTGLLLGLIAMFPIGYVNRWKIEPDFESDSMYAEGYYNVKGRIQIISILSTILSIILDKSCRKLYEKINML